MTEQQQEELKQLILSDKPAYFAKLREEVGDNPKALKAIAIVENIMRLADLTVEGVKLRSNKKKRIFPKSNRKTKRYFKIQKAKNLFVNAIQQKRQLAQLEMIQAQPLPKFPKGAMKRESEGLAYVGETGKEVVINKEGAIVSLPGSYQSDQLIPMVHDYERRSNYSQLGNYPYPVDQSTCNHIYGTKSDINNNWNGSMKAVCMKCGFEP